MVRLIARKRISAWEAVWKMAAVGAANTGMGTHCSWYYGKEARPKLGPLIIILILAILPGAFAAQANPASFSDVASRAMAAREANDVSGAIELYQQALKLNAQWSDGWWFLGSLQYGSGAYDAARDALSHYLELTPNAAPALAMRGLCEFETG